jgi:hypothetical protein
MYFILANAEHGIEFHPDLYFTNIFCYYLLIHHSLLVDLIDVTFKMIFWLI